MRRLIARAATSTVMLLAAASLLTAEDSVTFPMPFYKEALIVPVVFNGDEHLFVLDSGCSRTVFHSTFADRLGKPLADPSTSENDGEAFEYQRFTPPEAMLGSMPLPRNAPVVCVDLSTVRAALGRDIAGILGMPLFAACVIQLDFDRREIRLMPDTAEPSEEWGEPLGVYYSESDLPYVTARLASYENEPCMVDTGATYSLSLRKDVYKYLQGVKAISALANTKSATIAGFTESQQGVLCEFELGQRVHSKLRIKEGGSKSTIGLDYLRRYLVTFDLGNGKIYLRPGFDYDRPDDVEQIGIGLLRRERCTVVESVAPDSRALGAGFRAGDKLLSVDGVEVAGKPIAEIFWMLRAPTSDGEGKPITIEREGEQLALRLEGE